VRLECERSSSTTCATCSPRGRPHRGSRYHAFIPAKEPLEANLWGVHRSSGGYSTLFKERMLRGRQWADAPMERRFTGSKAEKVSIPGERLAGRPAERFEQLTNDEADMLLLNQSSESLDEVPDGSIDVVITDPPFADSLCTPSWLTTSTYGCGWRSRTTT
jgi:putative DNA methylase